MEVGYNYQGKETEHSCITVSCTVNDVVVQSVSEVRNYCYVVYVGVYIILKCCLVRENHYDVSSLGRVTKMD
jgi:hypothetical protein